MKKGLKVVGAVALAVVLTAGGFVGGQKYSENQFALIGAASPKQAMSVPPENSPSEDVPPVDKETPSDSVEGAADRIISKLAVSAVDDGTWTRVASSPLQTDGGGTLSLYTSAEKDSSGFLWDDSQKWVVEIDDGEGGYYTLYDQLVSNGMVYFDAAVRENGDVIITVYTTSGAGTVVTQYTKGDDGYSEKTVYNSGAVNRIFTSIPEYR